MMKFTFRVGLSVMALFCAATARAELVRVEWSGDILDPAVYTVLSPYEEFLNLSNHVSGSFIYDTEVGALTATGNTADYLSTGEISITAGTVIHGLEAIEGNGGTVKVGNNVSHSLFGAVDSMSIEMNGISDSGWAPGEELVMGLSMSWSSTGIFSSTALPTASELVTALSEPAFASGYILFPDGERIYMEFAPTVSATAVNPVPLPAAAWLFGSALLGLGFMRRRST